MRLVGTLAAAAMLAAACNTGGGSPTGKKSSAPVPPTGSPVQGGTASFAMPPSSNAFRMTPDYIFPLMNVADFTVANTTTFQYLFYRPLYFFGVGEKPIVNQKVSIAEPPRFSNGGRTVSITLKNYKWSDGQPVTARDVQFWQNLVTANKLNWAVYVPGSYPDNVLSTKVVNSNTIQFHLNKAYSPTWFAYNELSQITPLPQHVMDRTSATGPVGNYDMTNAGAVKVYDFLAGLSKDQAGYPGSSHPNAIWAVTDGPWKIQSYSTTGHIVFVPNPMYSGPEKPHLARFVELPFSSDAAELRALQSGNEITYGYLPGPDVAQKSALASRYHFVPWTDFGVDYFPANLNNPTVGAIFKQAYFRQVMEELIDQQAILNAHYAGYGSPTCGPVPLSPPNPYASAHEKSCPYSYNPSKAVSTLQAHGWHVVPNGLTTCARPGPGPDQCGVGIQAGAKTEFQYLYATGNAAFASSVAMMKSDASKAGIVYNLVPKPFSEVVSTAVPCKPTEADCKWEIGNWGGGWVYLSDYYPTGGELFATGAGSNVASYSNRTNDANIRATHLTGNAAQTLNSYQDYLTDQVPVIWQPNADYELSEISTKLGGAAPQNVYLNILPEEWYLRK